MEIFPHVHQIQSLVADRNLFQYLFVGDDVILLDTGASYTPGLGTILFLGRAGIRPSRLTMAINTHADADHHGGNSSLKQSAGDMLLACGDPDREMIENPDRLFASRYNQWMREHGVGLATNPDASAFVRTMAGPAHRIDLTFRGGERIAIDDRRALRVLHVPGHSDGHLALYDAANRAVFVGDALHGRYCPSADGDSGAAARLLFGASLFGYAAISGIVCSRMDLLRPLAGLPRCRGFRVSRGVPQIRGRGLVAGAEGAGSPTRRDHFAILHSGLRPSFRRLAREHAMVAHVPDARSPALPRTTGHDQKD